MYRVGDPVVYRKTKVSRHPGPRAEHVSAAQHGDDYVYEVDKFWVVDEVSPDGEEVLARTRRGKRHRLAADDPNLHKATLFERLRWRRRFPRRRRR